MGGAWKVAYADFVTAMMALFMVLWICSQDEEIILKTVEYFKDPFGIGFSDGKKGSVGDTDDVTLQGSSSASKDGDKSSIVDVALMHKLASEFYKKLNVSSNVENNKKNIKVSVTSDGLKITMFQRSDQPMFVNGSAEFTEWGNYVMQNLSWLVDRHKFKISIEAHLPKGYILDSQNYGPWELTADRSNEARKAFERFSLESNKVLKISGFADAQPLEDLPPSIPENERLEINLIL